MGKRVWNLEGTNEEIAREAIQKTEMFFHGLGVSTKLSEYTSEFKGAEVIICDLFSERGWTQMGERKSIDLDDISAIIQSSF